MIEAKKVLRARKKRGLTTIFILALHGQWFSLGIFAI
jgi:hypothetical protein